MFVILLTVLYKYRQTNCSSGGRLGTKSGQLGHKPLMTGTFSVQERDNVVNCKGREVLSKVGRGHLKRSICVNCVPLILFVYR